MSHRLRRQARPLYRTQMKDMSKSAVSPGHFGASSRVTFTSPPRPPHTAPVGMASEAKACQGYGY